MTTKEQASQTHSKVSKNDIELAKISLKQKTIEGVLEVIKIITVALIAFFSVYVIMNGLQNIVLAQPDQISAVAKLAEVINIKNITSYFLTLAAGAAWYRERKGKKRAISELGKMRAQLEAGDLGGRTSSNLTKTGDTPKEEEL